jgi:hypothetical protein
MGLFEEVSDCVGHHDGLVDCQLTLNEGGVNHLDFGARQGRRGLQ